MAFHGWKWPLNHPESLDFMADHRGVTDDSEGNGQLILDNERKSCLCFGSYQQTPCRATTRSYFIISFDISND